MHCSQKSISVYDWLYPNRAAKQEERVFFHVAQLYIFQSHASFAACPFLAFQAANNPRPHSQNFIVPNREPPNLLHAQRERDTFLLLICHSFFMTACPNVYNLPLGSFVFVMVYLAVPRPGAPCPADRQSLISSAEIHI